MNFDRLSRGEVIAAVGGLILAISVFLPWYGTDEDNRNSLIDGAQGSFSCWDVHGILRFLMLLAAIAPLILAWIVIREHELSWPRGEVTAVVAIAALGLLFYNGFVDRPGEPSSTISLKYGWVLAVIGAGLMLVGAVIRIGRGERKRKPPGVI
jgi:hypothetical protein